MTSAAAKPRDGAGSPIGEASLNMGGSCHNGCWEGEKVVRGKKRKGCKR